jgi:hypothetical protein
MPMEEFALLLPVYSTASTAQLNRNLVKMSLLKEHALLYVLVVILKKRLCFLFEFRRDLNQNEKISIEKFF